MKHFTVIIATILIIITVSASTYAWLTYVQRKSLASFETNEITVVLSSDETQIIDQISFNNLAFIDYQNDLIDNMTETFDLMASTWTVKLEISADSPMTINTLSFTQNEPGLIYILIYKGMNGELITPPSSLHNLMSTIISGSAIKSEQLTLIEDYNEIIIAQMSAQIFQPTDYIEFEIAAWADYDAVIDQANYLDQTFDLILTVESMNSKAEVLS